MRRWHCTRPPRHKLFNCGIDTSLMLACTQLGSMLMLRPAPRVNSKCPNAASRAARFGSGPKLGNGGQFGSGTGVGDTTTGGLGGGIGCGGGVAVAGFQALILAGLSSTLMRLIWPSGPA